MNTIHYVSITADGRVVRAESGDAIPPSILEDLMGLVAEHGAIVVGRKTYELFSAMGAAGAIPGVMAVLSSSMPPTDGVLVARSPQEALSRLADQGLTSVVVAGGPETYGAFQGAQPLDGLHLNIVPVLAGGGLQIATDPPVLQALELIATRSLGEGVVQLRYRSRTASD